jgi:hypothetical protein
MQRILEAAHENDAIDGAALGADGAGFDIDTFNDAEVAERRDWPLDRLFEEAAKNRVSLIAAIERLTEQDVEKVLHFAGDAKRAPGKLPLKLFLAGWAQHDPIHVADMVKALPERAADPALRTWLDNPSVAPFVGGYQKAMSGPPRM